MNKLLILIIKKIIHPIVIRIGYTETKRISNTFEKNNLLSNFYSILNKIKFSPNHIVDVGANHGKWSREALRFFPNAHITMVEPQHWLKNSFADLLSSNSKIIYHPVGVGKQSGSFNFTIVDRDDSSSFKFSEEEAIANGYKQVELPVLTLNEILKSQKTPCPDIIKIDAEGLDIDVLEGASDYFGKTEIFFIEAGVVKKDFQNSFFNIMNYMDHRGYRLFDITDLNRPFDLKVLWLVELVFVRKDGLLDSLTLNDIVC